MPRTTIVPLSQLYQYKLLVTAKSLIWYKQPITQYTTARIKLFKTVVDVGFGNQSTLGVKQVQYHIPDSVTLAGFYAKPIVIQLINNGSAQNGGQNVGYIQLDPRTITDKPIIAPILSSCCSCAKLGDIQIQFKLTKSATDIQQLREINKSLQGMIGKCPTHFQNLYCKLRRQGYVCGCASGNGGKCC